MISDAYKHLLKKEHGHDGSWGSRGYAWAYLVGGIALLEDCKTILDYGCGKSTLARTLERRSDLFEVREYDPGILGKDRAPESPVDMVVCTDVLEHVEPEYIDEVIGHLRGLTKKILFTVISTRPAGQILLDGRNAHLIVEPNEWWLKKLYGAGFKVRRDWKTAEQQLVVMAN